MKKLLLATALTLATATAHAGSAVYVAPVEPVVEEPEAMGGSTAWILPLIALGVIGFALMQQEEQGGDQGDD